MNYLTNWSPDALDLGHTTGFTVRMVDAKNVIIDALIDADKHAAAREFWKRTNNVSAMTGIIERVAIIRCDIPILMWEHDKGYTYDGETYNPTPVLPEKVKDYAKKAQKH